MHSLTEALRNLSQVQRRAVTAPRGLVAIVGAAGTGKTLTLALRVFSLLGAGARADEIVYLTSYARDVSSVQTVLHSWAEELRLSAPGDAPNGGGIPMPRDPSPGLRDLFVGTPDQYACHILRMLPPVKTGLSSPFVLLEEGELRSLASDLAKSLPDTPTISAAGIARFLQWHNRGRMAGRQGGQGQMEHAYWQVLAAALAEEKRRQGVLDRFDLPQAAADALSSDPSLAHIWRTTRARTIIIDSFQELTLCQHQLVEGLVGPESSVTVAVDPNQRVRDGVSPGAYWQFLRAVEPEHTYVLRLHHRAHQGLANVGQVLASTPWAGGLEPQEQTALTGAGTAPYCRVLDGPQVWSQPQLHEDLVALAERNVALGHRWEDMVCVFPEGYRIDDLVTQLISRQIPFNLQGGFQVAPRVEEEDSDADRIVALLRLVLNPNATGPLVAAACAGPRRHRRTLDPGVMARVWQISRDGGGALPTAAESVVADVDSRSHAYLDLRHFVDAWHKARRALDRPSATLGELVRELRSSLALVRGAQGEAPADPRYCRLLALAEQTLPASRETPRQVLARFLDGLSPVLHPDRDCLDTVPYHDPGRGISLIPIEDSGGLERAIVCVVGVSDRTVPVVPTRHMEEDRAHRNQRLIYTAATRARRGLYFFTQLSRGRGHDESLNPLVDALGDALVRVTDTMPRHRRRRITR